MVIHCAQLTTEGRLTKQKIAAINRADATMTKALAEGCLEEYQSNFTGRGPPADGGISVRTSSTARPAGSLRNSRFCLRAAFILIAIVVLAGPLLIDFYPGTLANPSEPKTGSGDFTLDMYGWKAFLPVFEKIRTDDIQSGRMSPDAPLLTHKWFPGGHLYYYLAHPLHLRMVGVGSVNDLHKFYWLNTLNGTVAQGADAYFITPSSYFADPNELYGSDFDKIEKPTRIEQKRNGRTARYWYVYRLKGCPKPPGSI